jgi:aspartyl aminopeptidase
LRIPNLAIHLNREIDSAGFNPNKQAHVLPVFGTASKVDDIKVYVIVIDAII